MPFIKSTLIAGFILLSQLFFAQQKPIPPLMAGINWQLTDSIGTGSLQVTGGKVNELLPKLTGVSPRLIRIGGNDWDRKGATREQFAKAYDSIINKLNAVPLVQIPVYHKYGTSSTATFNHYPSDAKALLDYLNVTNSFNIQYISIGNEPIVYDLHSGCKNRNRQGFMRFLLNDLQGKVSLMNLPDSVHCQLLRIYKTKSGVN